jgi:bifunctional non-homologous end joining protein LigD
VDFRRSPPHQRWCSLACAQLGKRHAGGTQRRNAVALPRVQPIAPVRSKEPFDDPEWLFDLKYDGFRALCYLKDRRCRLISRYGNPMHRFAGRADQIAASLDVSDAILDGRGYRSRRNGSAAIL